MYLMRYCSLHQLYFHIFQLFLVLFALAWDLGEWIKWYVLSTAATTMLEKYHSY